MKMLRYLLPLLLVSVTCTSASSSVSSSASSTSVSSSKVSTASSAAWTSSALSALEKRLLREKVEVQVTETSRRGRRYLNIFMVQPGLLQLLSVSSGSDQG